MANISWLYADTRPADFRPDLDRLAAQKTLRAKLFGEFVGLVEAFGMLCISIASRRKQSVLWSYMNVEPQEVTQFYSRVLASSRTLSLQRLLNLPSPNRIERAAAEQAHSRFAGGKYPVQPHQVIAANIRLVAEMYRAPGSVHVRTHNKLKHGFVAVDDASWLGGSLPAECIHVLVDDSHLPDAAKIGVRSLPLAQADIDLEMTNIVRVTQMGAELLALTLALHELGLLYGAPDPEA